ncbi:hypothetical protein Bca52824_090800 [Brassica carinata]|uniref:Uncharacterized protein n=1 Tax=Brassica carinata TaxID=52824 RepID=A0A8X7NVK3_BRACI|nr:hypothetical protein Bca52824_090800 [Brassica carinata]
MADQSLHSLTNPHFFQPLLPGFHTHLSVPIAFFGKHVQGSYDHIKTAKPRTDRPIKPDMKEIWCSMSHLSDQVAVTFNILHHHLTTSMMIVMIDDQQTGTRFVLCNNYELNFFEQAVQEMLRLTMRANHGLLVCFSESGSKYYISRGGESGVLITAATFETYLGSIWLEMGKVLHYCVCVLKVKSVLNCSANTWAAW